LYRGHPHGRAGDLFITGRKKFLHESHDRINAQVLADFEEGYKKTAE
jgi:hypothetical protein